MRSDWENALAREGLAHVEAKPAESEDAIPCPACGTTAPLVDGACSDCGLTLG